MQRLDYKTIDKLNEICSYLEDDLSKIVLKQRFLTNLTNDLSHIHNMLEYVDTFDFSKAYESFQEIDLNYGIYTQLDVLAWICSRAQKSKIVLFGAGRNAKDFIGLLKLAGVKIEGVFDNKCESSQIYGIPVYRPDTVHMELLKQSDIIITSVIYADEISRQLEMLGIDAEKIYKPDGNSLISYSPDVYFDSSIWKPDAHEIFVDAGCYNMYTSKQFAKWCPDYDEIYAFEPDADNYKLCQDNVKKYGLRDVKVLNAGLWDEETTVHFNHHGDKGAGSYIDQVGTESIKTAKLDSVLNGNRCTLIKMDIEGAELKALMGASETIKKWKPKLAICIYHKPEDIIELPVYIKSLVPEYKIKMRHYSTYFYDTVMYAYID